MNHYTHLYGSTVINANRIRSMVNLTLEACVRYPLYIVIYCKRVHYTTDSLVWGSFRLAPINKNSSLLLKDTGYLPLKQYIAAFYGYDYMRRITTNVFNSYMWLHLHGFINPWLPLTLKMLSCITIHIVIL